jgi:DNA-binding transcriptional LysR family regulator
LYTREAGPVQLQAVSKFLSDKILLLGLNGGKDRVIDICRQKGFTPADIYYQSSDFLLSQMVADGVGYTVTANLFAFNEKHKPLLHIVPLTDFKEPIVAAWRKQEKGDWLSRFLSLLDGMYATS